ncbi:MAG: NUDIX hydrolase [Hymenobacteraceae bacterium]|nr:NUDIX hydrolase [Hymenobacteraceae bacterium]MDX5397368.1 NUDIX hydrolase [Hymenobacteraceae bacterium]MDX5443875.1 NUDIX hydrolase [Hymenobacteraceae bacterium]MDX5513448.1 NUDIX hydrolase [Hymenobacteraceae bacterium]
MEDFNQRASRYAERVRVRVCGICLQNNKVLVVKHQALDQVNNAFWSPPGGGLEYGESLRDCLAREFEEETGIQVKVGNLLYVNEFLDKPLHAIELFFEVEPQSGSVKTGTDPEAAADDQLIEQVQFLTLPELKAIPNSDKHQIFHFLTSLDDLLIPHHNLFDQKL